MKYLICFAAYIVSTILGAAMFTALVNGHCEECRDWIYLESEK